MRLIEADKTDTLDLGRVGENNCTQVIFAAIVQRWLAEYPGATIGLVNRPSRQGEGYPVGSTVRAGQAVIWTVQSADLAEGGWGECQLFAMEGETIVKSEYWRTRVLASLDGSATPPDPWKSWQAAFLGMKNAAEAAADRAEEAAVHSPIIQDDIWQVWDFETGAYVSTGIVAEGQNAYVHYRWASHEPTQDSDMSTDPGPWQGVYSGSSATAPEHYTDYTWNNVQGPQGPQGLAFTFEDGGTGLVLKPLEQEV